MSTEAARTLRQDRHHTLRDDAPRQAMIDGFWVGLKQIQKFVSSSDNGYHCGRWEDVGDHACVDAIVSGLA